MTYLESLVGVCIPIMRTPSLVTILFEYRFKAPYIDFCVQYSPDDILSIGRHGNDQVFIVVQKWLAYRLVYLEVPDANRAVH